MGTGKTYSTKYLLDSNNSSGVAGQVLISTPSGIDWVDGSGSSVIGGPYLPLSAGSSYPLTGDLYLDDGSGASPSLYFKNQSDNFWRHLMESGGDFSIKEGTSTRLKFQAGGNVGIGTTSPGAKLDVIGQGIFQGSTNSPYKGANVGTLNINNNSGDGTVDFTQGLVFTDNVTNQGSWTHAGIVSVGSTGYNGSLVFGTDGDGVRNTSGITEKMRITSAGNVGIGTPSPQDLLEVRAADGVTGVIRVQGGKNTVTSIGEVNSRLDFGSNDGSVASPFVGGRIASVTELTNGARTGLAFSTYLQSRPGDDLMEFVRITSEGNVGIGTTSPQRNLTVYESSGNAVLQLANSTSGVGASDGFLAYTDGVNVGLENKENGYLSLATNASERMRIDGSGNVGILTTSMLNTGTNRGSLTIGGSVAGTINIGNGSINFGIYATTAESNIYSLGVMKFSVGSGLPERMRIDSDGNVGIGTTNTNRKLTVIDDGAANGSQNITAQFSNQTSGATSSALYIGASTGADWLIGKNIYGVSSQSYFQIGNQAGTTPALTINHTTNNATFAGDITTSGNIILSGASNEIIKSNGSIRLNIDSDNNQTDRVFIVSTGANSELFRVQEDGNVGIGATSPGRPLTINSDTSHRAIRILENDLGNESWDIGVDVDGDLNFFNSADTSPSVTFLDNGNVGIGAANPLNKLFVSANTAGDYAAFIENTNSTNGYGLVARTANTGTSSYAFAARAASSDIFVVRADGNVGIGTTSPQNLLHLGDNANSKAGTIRIDSFVANQFWKIEPGTNTLNIKDYDGTSLVSFDGASNYALFNGGNVGIGTTSPATKLQISAANASSPTANIFLDIDGSNQPGMGGQIMFGASTSASATQYIATIQGVRSLLDNGSSDLHFQTTHAVTAAAPSTKMTILSDGNVGIGTTSPAVQLELGDNTADEKLRLTGAASGKPLMTFYNTTTKIGQIASSSVGITVTSLGSGNMSFENGGNTSLVIDNSGNVGIADTSPSYKLDVDGTIRATGDVIAYSDVRVKENIKTIDNALEKVNKLRGVEFNKIGSEEKSIGVIAQEIEKVLPEVVKEDDKGMKSVAYGNIVGVLIEAIKDQQKQIDELKSIINGGTK